MRTFGWCSVADVLEAFHIVSREIRSKLKRLESSGALTQGEACQLALRLRDQRELIRQLATRRHFRRARRLMRINRRLRRRLIRLVEAAALSARVLIFR
ncbi:MAG TPA: hypothetical protein EYP56_20385 [Planctomycetaceae bacterium]|nr:hypothetical protein [Planctomycetaceae bacterium]HIQ21672.1 hypothetical protein [Planctomycetota bacterium]